MSTTRIAMIYRETGTCGGIQRGASFQVGQFKEWGWEPIVLTEADLGRGECRAARLAAILRERKADVVIEHDAYSEDKLSADISAARDIGVPIVVFWHSVFSWMIANGNSRAASIFRLLSMADGLITLSTTDEAFFRMMGCRASAIPYCDTDLMPGFVRRDYPHDILWMGRLVDLKRPLDAVRIVELLRMKVPDATLTMLGDGSPEIRMAIEKYIGERPDLCNAIRLEGFRQDVRPYLEKAGVGLVTSRFEGFCHAAVEMKMASIPVVAYSMPYLDTLSAGTGAIQVPQGDIAAAAEAIGNLFSDVGKLAEQGMRARQSYERLRGFDQHTAYLELFADLSRPPSESSLKAVDPARMKNAIDVLAEHCVSGFDAVKMRMKRKCCGDSGGRGVSARLGRAFLRAGRFLCGFSGSWK